MPPQDASSPTPNMCVKSPLQTSLPFRLLAEQRCWFCVKKPLPVTPEMSRAELRTQLRFRPYSSASSQSHSGSSDALKSLPRKRHRTLSDEPSRMIPVIQPMRARSVSPTMERADASLQNQSCSFSSIHKDVVPLTLDVLRWRSTPRMQTHDMDVDSMDTHLGHIKPIQPGPGPDLDAYANFCLNVLRPCHVTGGGDTVTKMPKPKVLLKAKPRLLLQSRLHQPSARVVPRPTVLHTSPPASVGTHKEDDDTPSPRRNRPDAMDPSAYAGKRLHCTAQSHVIKDDTDGDLADLVWRHLALAENETAFASKSKRRVVASLSPCRVRTVCALLMDRRVEGLQLAGGRKSLGLEGKGTIRMKIEQVGFSCSDCIM